MFGGTMVGGTRAIRIGQAIPAPLAIGTSAFLILVLRDPQALTHPAFLNEVIGGFWAATFVRPPLDTLLIPWNGFAYGVVRVAFLAGRLVPVVSAPAVTWLLFALALSLIAAFVASERMAIALPRPALRYVAALGIVLLPFAGATVYATVLNVHFWLAIYLALLLLATPPPSVAWRVGDLVGAAIAAFSGPASLMLAPLYLARTHRHPALSGIVLAGATAELATFLSSSRRPLVGSPLTLFAVAVERSLIAPLGDGLGFWLDGRLLLVLAVATLVALLLPFAATGLPRSTFAVLGYLAITFAAAGTTVNSLSVMEQPTLEERYFVPAAWLLLVVAASALLHQRRAGLVLAGLFVASIVWAAPVLPNAGPSWLCVGSLHPCTVGLTYWPGSAQEYRLPVGLGDGKWIFP